MMLEFKATTFVNQEKLSNPINFLVGTGNVMTGKAGRCTVTMYNASDEVHLT